MYIITLTILTIVVGQICTIDPEIESLKLQVERLSALSQENHQKIQNLESLYISEHNERLALEKSLAELQYPKNMTASRLFRNSRSGPPVFAFHAVLSKKFIATQDNQVIHFDYVTADYPTRHGHYNKTTGVYTCAVEGFYYFTWTIGANGSGSFAQTSLMKNGDWMGMLVAYDSFASSSSSVIMHLAINDRVWVEVETNGSSVLNDVSSFLGFRLAD